MLRQLFVSVHFRYTRSPHVADLTAFARWLLDHRYSARYAQRLVFWAKRSLEAFPLPPMSTWSTEQLERAFERWGRRCLRLRKEYRDARSTFGNFLVASGRLIRSASHPHAPLIAAYRRYLSEVRGLAPATEIQHLWEVSTFLRATLPHGGPVTRLTPRAIELYTEHRAGAVSRRSVHTTVTQLQAFFRYCLDQGVIAKRLDLIDRPRGFRQELPPRALDWALIERFLNAIDGTGSHGWRDFMLLHLMAHYGLRTGEITYLTLDSIDWSARTLLVEQPKTHGRVTMPLLDETLVLLRRYLKEGRRASARRELFLCAKAPDRPMTKYLVSSTFKLHARPSGLPIAHASAYALRHSFAMRLFRRGVGIKLIGDLMGHNSLISTAVYLRLQSDVLREVALPVPTESRAIGGAA
jgi:integrase/recombinase XerD